MAIESTTALNEENAKLKSQLAQSVDQVNNFMNHLEAHKQMLNEALQSSLNLRAVVVGLQRQIQDLTNKLKAAEDAVSNNKPDLKSVKEVPSCR